MFGIAFLVGFFVGGFSLIMLVYRAIQGFSTMAWRGWRIRSGRSSSAGGRPSDPGPGGAKEQEVTLPLRDARLRAHTAPHLVEGMSAAAKAAKQRAQPVG